MELITVDIENPQALNLIIGQSHFIKTVEDLHETIISTVPNAQFGLAFCEASGKRLIRSSGTNGELVKLAEENAMNISAGHSFIIFLKDFFPINILPSIKNIPEICKIYCATANPTQVILAKTQLGRGIIGIIDGQPPLGIEDKEEKKWRHDFLRKIGYKLDL